MHGNSSARVEVVPQLALCLSIGATCLAFDFAGSGQSDGEAANQQSPALIAHGPGTRARETHGHTGT